MISFFSWVGISIVPLYCLFNSFNSVGLVSSLCLILMGLWLLQVIYSYSLIWFCLFCSFFGRGLLFASDYQPGVLGCMPISIWVILLLYYWSGLLFYFINLF